MPTVSTKFTVTTTLDGAEKAKEGSVMLYSETELDDLEASGLEKPHRTLLNQIVKIRAMDAVRLTMQEQSPLTKARALAKTNPEFAAKLKALLGEAGL